MHSLKQITTCFLKNLLSKNPQPLLKGRKHPFQPHHLPLPSLNSLRHSVILSSCESFRKQYVLFSDHMRKVQQDNVFSHCFLLGVPTLVKTNMLIRSMGPVSELDMDYSMDCYFRQYWRDKRLSFKGPIQSLSLSIKVRFFVYFKETLLFFRWNRCWIRFGGPTLISTMESIHISIWLLCQISCWDWVRTVTFCILWDWQLKLLVQCIWLASPWITSRAL